MERKGVEANPYNDPHVIAGAGVGGKFYEREEKKYERGAEWGEGGERARAHRSEILRGIWGFQKAEKETETENAQASVRATVEEEAGAKSGTSE